MTANQRTFTQIHGTIQLYKNINEAQWVASDDKLSFCKFNTCAALMLTYNSENIVHMIKVKYFNTFWITAIMEQV